MKTFQNWIATVMTVACGLVPPSQAQTEPGCWDLKFHEGEAACDAPFLCGGGSGSVVFPGSMGGVPFVGSVQLGAGANVCCAVVRVIPPHDDLVPGKYVIEKKGTIAGWMLFGRCARTWFLIFPTGYVCEYSRPIPYGEFPLYQRVSLCDEQGPRAD